MQRLSSSHTQRLASLLLLLCLPLVIHAVPKNALKNHPAPYLAMHGDDPVAWQTWGRAVIERARKEDKLLYVSIGYFSCHWCHVMQRESYADKEIASVINEHFIPVKVDRELQPALDQRLINFVEKTTGRAGWPLNVFVTPEGNPLAGFTYLPKDRFRSYLDNLAGRWQSDRKTLKQISRDAVEIIDGEAGVATRGMDMKQAGDYISGFLSQALAIADRMQGGFGRDNKFPMTPQLAALIKLSARMHDQMTNEFLTLTLASMSTLGMRDQIGGGFFRYAVDPGWEIPHFEKMLYDNAQLAMLYLRATDVLQQPAWAVIGRNTLDFMIRDLMTADGGLIASLSAVDDNNVEGGYYLWDDDELAALLSDEELAVARAYWGMDSVPELDGGHLPEQGRSLAEIASQLKLERKRLVTDLDQILDKLRAARSKRTVPRDTKILAGWNGLALSAFAYAGSAPDGDKYSRAAARVRDYLVTRLWDGKQLHRSLSADKPLGNAALADYAYVARGLLDYAMYLDRPGDLKLVRQVVDQAWRRFHTDDGWLIDEDSLIPLGATEPVLADSALPSPSAVLLETSLRLAAATGDDELHDRSLAQLQLRVDNFDSSPFYYATHLVLLVDYPPESATTEKTDQP